MWSQDLYSKAWAFACHAHHGQTMLCGTLPYVNHIANVTMELIAALARHSDIDAEQQDLGIQAALLHDVIEDTPTTYDQIERHFGASVAAAVLALTKNPALPSKQAQMKDSLLRIRHQPRVVWMVKLADRIVNLSQAPAAWTQERCLAYSKEGQMILCELGTACCYLEHRLSQRIAHYPCSELAGSRQMPWPQPDQITPEERIVPSSESRPLR